MWPGPYGNSTCKKGLLASLDQSLKRLDLEYVDLFYAHRWLDDVPVDEIADALDTAVRQGKALYAGVSKWPAERVDEAVEISETEAKTPVIIHQICFNLLWRNADLVKKWLPQAEDQELGVIVFSPLANGLLTDRYAGGKIPQGARANLWNDEWRKRHFSDENLAKIAGLSEIAKERGEPLPIMALSWLLHDPRVTSVLIGASRVAQLEENLRALQSPAFTEDQLERIDRLTLA
jgi:L-glyceraldehyde 3-phosphate reductase